MGARDRVAMLQIDLEKAFDRVRHQVFFCILEHAGAGNVIFEAVKCHIIIDTPV